jgi:ATP-dependent DNA ligase
MEAKSPTLFYADYVEEFGVDFFRMICDKDLEGIVAKHRASAYDPSAKWIKIKNPAYTQAEGRHELLRGSESDSNGQRKLDRFSSGHAGIHSFRPVRF